MCIALPEAEQERSRVEHFASVEHEAAMVPRPRGLHHGQVRHEHVRPRNVGGV
jgi:hypothetical protein